MITPELRRSTGADHDPERRGESQRARARDDQHGHRSGERIVGVAGDREPGEQRQHGDADRRRHEHRRHPVGESLHLGATALRLVDEADDLGERSVGTDPNRLDDERAVGVDRGADHLVAGAHFDGHRLAGHHRGIDTGVAIDDHAIGCDLLAGPDHEPSTDRQLVERNLGAVLEPRRANAEVGQRADGVA